MPCYRHPRTALIGLTAALIKKHAVSLVLIAVLTYSCGNSLRIATKAMLAQWLIAHSWQQGQASKPWPWADTYPIAKLDYPKSDTSHYVLAGTDGASLAFGPGWQPASAPIGLGTSLIAGHNDTHFRFLKDVQHHDEFVITTLDGSEHRYSVVATQIVNTNNHELMVDISQDRLLLTTCYPFDSVGNNTPYRWVVEAVRV